MVKDKTQDAATKDNRLQKVVAPAQNRCRLTAYNNTEWCDAVAKAAAAYAPKFINPANQWLPLPNAGRTVAALLFRF